MQKHQNWPAHSARSAARQGNAVWQAVRDQSDHIAMPFVAVEDSNMPARQVLGLKVTTQGDFFRSGCGRAALVEQRRLVVLYRRSHRCRFFWFFSRVNPVPQVLPDFFYPAFFQR